MSHDLPTLEATAAESTPEATAPTPEPAQDPRWQPRPRSPQNGFDRPAIEFGMRPPGGMTALLHLTHPGMRPVLDQAVTDVADRIRGRLGAAAAGDEAMIRFTSLREQYTAAVTAERDTGKKVADLDGRRAKLAQTASKGLAGKLVALDAQIDQARSDHTQAGAELRTIAPLYRDAKAAARERILKLAREVSAACFQEEEENLDRILCALVDGAQRLLTEAAKARRRRDVAYSCVNANQVADVLLADEVPPAE